MKVKTKPQVKKPAPAKAQPKQAPKPTSKASKPEPKPEPKADAKPAPKLPSAPKGHVLVRTTQEDLGNALRAVTGVVKDRSTLPILACVLLRVDKGRVTITSSNLDMTAQAVLDTATSGTGAVAIPAARLTAIVRELGPELSLDLNLERHTCTVSVGDSVYELPGMAAEEFPPLDELEGEAIVMEGTTLARMLRQTSFATCQDKSRPGLCGVIVEVKKNTLTMVGVDGKRLARVDEPVKAKFDGQFIIPNEALPEARRALEGAEGDMTLYLSAKRFALVLPKLSFQAKLVDATPSNWRQVIPAEVAHTFPISRESLMRSLRRISIMLNDRVNSVRLSLKDNRIEMALNSAETGTAREVVFAKHDAKMTMAHSPTHWAEALAVAETDEVTLKVQDELTPAAFESGSFYYLAAPFRLS